MKYHKDHLDSNIIEPCRGKYRLVSILHDLHKPFANPSCSFDAATIYFEVDTKELLLRASTSDDQKNWVSQLSKKIPKKPPVAPPVDSFGGR